MTKLIQTGKEAQQSLIEGSRKLAEIVGCTLGPTASNVLIERQWAAPQVVHDGVTVAKEVELEDPFEDKAAQLVKEAAAKTNDKTGDGTTTSTILASAMIAEGFKKIDNGTNRMKLRKGMQAATKRLKDEISKNVKIIKDFEEKVRIATVSAQDEEIGKLIAEAYEKVGADGVVTVEEGRGIDVTVEYKMGMQFAKGYASPYFVTNTDKMIAEIDDPFVFITDQRISSLMDLKVILEAVVSTGLKNVVLIAEDFDGEALPTLVVNKLKGNIGVIAIKAPEFGEQRRQILEDIAVLTGATVISPDTGRKIDTVTIADFGRARKVKSDADETTIIDGKGEEEKIKERVEQINKLMESTNSDFEKDKLKQRKAKLTSGIAIIEVGGMTEMEMTEKKERAIDAVAATRAALEGGILPGGGSVYIHLSNALDELKGEPDFLQGVDVIRKSIHMPFMTLMDNAGLVPGDNLVKVRDCEFEEGIDVFDGQLKNLYEAGIIDPAKVSLSALENATSVASTAITTYALIVDKPSANDVPKP